MQTIPSLCISQVKVKLQGIIAINHVFIVNGLAIPAVIYCYHDDEVMALHDAHSESLYSSNIVLQQYGVVIG